MKLGLEASMNEDGIASLKCCQDFFRSPIFHWFHVDVIRIMGIQHEDVLHAGAGCDGEASSLIRVNCAIGSPSHHGGKACIGAGAIGKSRGEIGCWHRLCDSDRWGWLLSRVCTLSELVHMAFGSCAGLEGGWFFRLFELSPGKPSMKLLSRAF